MSKPISKALLLKNKNPEACFPEQIEREEHAGYTLWRSLSWSCWHRWQSSRSLAWIVEPVLRRGKELEGLDAAALQTEATALREQLSRHGLQRHLIANCFALIREISFRIKGMRHFPSQLMGGLALLQGNIAEMATGEGKTLTATLPACTAALAGLPVHVITVNDYLVQRDAELMEPVYKALGLTVGCIIQGMDPQQRIAAYRSDITYCNNKELVFDYLKDRITLGAMSSPAHLHLEKLYRSKPRSGRLMHRGLYFAIVDEADSVMADEARTPLIIAGQKSARFDESVYQQAVRLAAALQSPADFTLVSSDRRATLTETGKQRLVSLINAQDPFWQVRPYREELVTIALQALHCYARDRQYLIDEGKIQIIDEFTGRVMPDRNWEGGLHQMIEAKEGCEITGSQETIARITYQRFFRRYLHLAGMTGTGAEVAKEMWLVYRLKSVRIPTNRPCLRHRLPDQIYASRAEKWQAIVEHITTIHQRDNRPLLVGTRSVEDSEHLSGLLEQAALEHVVLNARQDKQEAEIISHAGGLGQIIIATNMAGRGTDIHLGKGVAARGGLHVILTECHEARRIDRQLFGRAARQGDPGSCVAIISLEDEVSSGLVESLPAMMQPFFAQRHRLPAWARRLLVLLAQVSAERKHAAIRKETLRSDRRLDQMLSFTGKVE